MPKFKEYKSHFKDNCHKYLDHSTADSVVKKAGKKHYLSLFKGVTHALADKKLEENAQLKALFSTLLGKIDPKKLEKKDKEKFKATLAKHNAHIQKSAAEKAEKVAKALVIAETAKQQAAQHAAQAAALQAAQQAAEAARLAEQARMRQIPKGERDFLIQSLGVNPFESLQTKVHLNQLPLDTALKTIFALFDRQETDLARRLNSLGIHNHTVEERLQAEHSTFGERENLIAFTRAYVASKMSPAAYNDLIKAMKAQFTDIPKTVEEFDLLLRFDMDPRHLAHGVDLNIPARPANTTIDELALVFNKINFTDPNLPNFLDPMVQFKEDFNTDWIYPHHNEADRRAVLVTNLKATLQLLLERIIGRQHYTATPAPGTQALIHFWQVVENAITNTLSKLKTLDDSPASNARRAQTVIQILRAAAHCGIRVQETAISCYREQVLGIPQDNAAFTYNQLGQFRSALAESRLTPPNGESIVYHTKLLHALGREFGIPAYAISAENGPAGYNFGGNFNAARDRVRFRGVYTSASAIDWLKTESKDRLIDIIKAAIPASFQPQELQAAAEAIAAMKRQGKSNEDIIAVLQRDPYYIGSIGQTPEQALIDARAHLFLEQHAVEDMNSPVMQIKPEALTSALVGLQVLRPAFQFA